MSRNIWYEKTKTLEHFVMRWIFKLSQPFSFVIILRYTSRIFWWFIPKSICTNMFSKILNDITYDAAFWGRLGVGEGLRGDWAKGQAFASTCFKTFKKYNSNMDSEMSSLNLRIRMFEGKLDFNTTNMRISENLEFECCIFTPSSSLYSEIR